ncbi:MAG TPA: formylglycine-generating enzyme family protein [Pirellulales bacterium]|nr:formylglycine-generating enzyme family protein [Pirellulales bacterium]
MAATEVRIFLSSPGDVREERDRARRVIAGLERHYPGLTLTPVLWEDLALPVTASFQDGIDCVLSKRPIDVAVFILWSRLGTPVRLSGKEYRSGTEREFELMLAAFEQSGGKRPIILAYTRGDDAGFRQRLVTAPAGSLEDLIAQHKLAAQFIRENFKDAEGRNLRAYHGYSGPIEFAQRLRLHLRDAVDEILGADAAPRWRHEPYRALARFDTEHAAIFHGRDEETCDLLQRLRDQERAGAAFAVIVGASGSGKSSLARAGVAATLSQYPGDDDVKQWRPAFFTPGLEANDLVRGLVGLLAEVVPELNTTRTALDDVAAGLHRDAPLTVRLSISPAVARAAERVGGPVRVLLVIDQMEELWTDPKPISAEERKTFLDAVEALARSGLVAVLATLRSDFYAKAQQMPAFVRLKGERGHFDLLPPGPASLRRLITEPARLAGLRFERNDQTGRTLDELVLEDAMRDASSLPLLEYALSELHQRCVAAPPAPSGTEADDAKPPRPLTFAVYKALGGVEGALANRASEVFGRLPAEAQAALDDILPLLVTIDVTRDQTAWRDGRRDESFGEAGAEETSEQPAVRRRAPLAKLTCTEARKALTEQLIEARFVTTDLAGGVPIASFAHEALLRGWQRMADWIAENREYLRLRARVEQSERLWEQARCDKSFLLAAGLPLEEGRRLLGGRRQLLTERTAEYIDLSIALDERRARLRKAAVVALGILTLVFAGLATFAGWQWMRAEAADEEAIDGQVKTLLTADEDNLQGILIGLSLHRQRVRDKLRTAASRGTDSTQQLRASLGLLAIGDTDRLPYLQRRVLLANPVELLVIREQLRPHSRECVPTFWSRLEDASLDDAQRFRAAGALGLLDSETKAWHTHAPYVAQQLARQDTSQLGDWIHVLRPVGEKLVPQLSAILADRQAKPTIRIGAISALAAYATPRDLVVAIAEANADELPLLLDFARQRGRDQTIELLTSIVRLKLDDLGAVPLDAASADDSRRSDVTGKSDNLVMLTSGDAPQNQKTAQPGVVLGGKEAHQEKKRVDLADARRLANAAAGLLLFEQDGAAWQVLRANPRPSARSFLIKLCAVVEVPPQRLWKRVKEENDVSLRRALIYALGNYGGDKLPPPVQNEARAYLLKVYREDEDAGVHAAAEWTLRQWGHAKDVDQIDGELAGQSAAKWSAPLPDAETAGWHVNSQRQTFVTLSPREFYKTGLRGDGGQSKADDASFEELVPTRLPYPFAFAMKEVTNQSFDRFLKATKLDPPAKDSDRYSPDLLGPRPGVSWLLAAKYCRWLSEVEGVPEEQQCFPPIGEIRDGMKLPENWLSRTGYRLPTEAEWECACRAGTVTERYYGEGTELLGDYAWYNGNNQAAVAYVGGLKKANDNGIFDLYGNGFEWCMDGEQLVRDEEQREVVSAQGKRFARGGGMASPPDAVRTAYRASFEASRGGFTFVLRLARTLPANE